MSLQLKLGRASCTAAGVSLKLDNDHARWSPMGILGIGVDVLYVPRILSLMQRQGNARFARRILSDKEYTVWNAIATDDEVKRTRYLAVRYVALAVVQILV